MAYFRKEPHYLKPSLLTANPSLNLFLRYETVQIFRFKVCRWINIRKTFIIMELFPMEYAIRLKVLLLKLGLLNLELLPGLCLFQCFLLLLRKRPILHILTIPCPRALITRYIIRLLPHLFIHFSSLLPFFLCLLILNQLNNLILNFLVILRKCLFKLIQLIFNFLVCLAEYVTFYLYVWVGAYSSVLEFVHLLVKVVDWNAVFLVCTCSVEFWFSDVLKCHEVVALLYLLVLL